MSSSDALRGRLRSARRGVTGDARERATDAIVASLTASGWWRTADHIALYLAADGEVDLRAAGAAARSDGRTTWYPAVAGDVLEFRCWDGDGALETGRFGIPVPPAGITRPATALDLVVVPLVGFDRRGGRLGMGAGFYDRTFAFRTEDRTGSPRLVGVGFAVQEVGRVETHAADVALDAVVTPEGWLDVDP